MSLIVQKYGGTSVADIERLRAVAEQIVETSIAGNSVVVVVSAMGDVTDDLQSLAMEVGTDPSGREMDMLLATGEQVTCALLAMTVQSLGHDAISYTGPQIGIVTDSGHTKAKIREVRAQKVMAALDEGKIVIVAGFQGVTSDGEITTLGRGGSDTTAVAVAAGIAADVCEIYTDVEGVYTADPRIVGDARKLDSISYEEMLEMAAAGAKVLQQRSVEFARNHGVVIHVRSSFNRTPGTVVREVEDDMEQPIISGISHDTTEVKITIRDVPDRPGVAADVFSDLAEHNVNVDMIIQNVSEDGATDLSFTVPRDDLPSAKRVVGSIVGGLEARGWSVDEDIAKITLVGAGMKTHPGIAAAMFRTLADAGVNIDMISTSPIRISCVVDAEQVNDAVRALHTTFELGEDPEEV